MYSKLSWNMAWSVSSIAYQDMHQVARVNRMLTSHDLDVYLPHPKENDLEQLFIFPKYQSLLPTVQLASVGYAALFLIIGFIDFRRRRMK